MELEPEKNARIISETIKRLFPVLFITFGFSIVVGSWVFRGQAEAVTSSGTFTRFDFAVKSMMFFFQGVIVVIFGIGAKRGNRTAFMILYCWLLFVAVPMILSVRTMDLKALVPAGSYVLCLFSLYPYFRAHTELANEEGFEGMFPHHKQKRWWIGGLLTVALYFFCTLAAAIVKAAMSGA